MNSYRVAGLIKHLAVMPANVAIDLLNRLDLDVEQMEYYFDQLAVCWISQDSEVVEGSFSWFEQWQTETPRFIKYQLSKLSLSESEKLEVRVTILYRAGLLAATPASKAAKEFQELSSILRREFSQDNE